ncbi:Uncharacterised protein [Mycobacteroides abscessus subsp. abscessus]|nr:Uncharacterised protein [Mycobacteroides abscessus subsp. abscessus]
MCDGQRREIDRVGGDAAEFITATHAVQIVVVCARNELGDARTSTRQLQEGELGGVRAVVLERLRQQRVEVVGVDPPGHRINLRRNRVGESAIVESRVLAWRDDRGGTGSARDTDEFACTMSGKREHRDRAESEQREDGFDVADPVRDLHQHTVIWRNPEFDEARRDPADAIVQLHVGEPAVDVDDSGMVGGRRVVGPRAQDVVERLPHPQSVGSIFRFQFRGPWRHEHKGEATLMAWLSRRSPRTRFPTDRSRSASTGSWNPRAPRC